MIKYLMVGFEAQKMSKRKYMISIFCVCVTRPDREEVLLIDRGSILDIEVQLNFVMSKWSGPRKILRHRNGSRQPIGHYGERNLLAKYQF